MHLAAQMPPAKIGARGLMELRVARKIAALSGIPGGPETADDAGLGRTWLADYARLTTTEITLGGPVVADPGQPDGGLFLRPGPGRRRFSHVDGSDVDYAPIPNVAVQGYGPDTKAALVLTGVNRVLEPVTSAVRRALDDIRRQVDSPSLLVAVGLCLLQEVFAAQPILFRNGVQAAQIQRALLLPRPEPMRPNRRQRPLSRIEHGGHPGPELKHRPQHLDVIHGLWESVAARGQYDECGRLRGDEPSLRFNPLFGFEQNDIVAATGRPENRTWLIATLSDVSEALLTGGMSGAPLSTILIEDPPGRPPYAEVVVPRQRQVELIVASMARRLAPLRLDRPIRKGQVLTLPELDARAWTGSGRTTRRAVLLAHYYSLRAAGWFSGMIKLDHRRSRDECALRCRDLVGAVAMLLDADDPLRDQITAFALGYLQQYEASFGQGAETYPELMDVLWRLDARVSDGRGGKAILIELLPLVLDNLRSVRRAVSTGVCTGLSAEQLTRDLERWWCRARELRDELIDDPQERSHLDYGYARFLLDPASDDAGLRRGLRLIEQVTASRECAAQREGGWVALRVSYLAELQGLTEALHRWADTEQAAGYPRRAFDVARALTDHEETWTYLRQRIDPSRPGRASYDGGALMLLVTLTQGWLAALRAADLDAERVEVARRGGERATGELRGYLRTMRDEPRTPPGGLPGSRLDPYRARLADDALREWDTWARAGAGAAG